MVSLLRDSINLPLDLELRLITTIGIAYFYNLNSFKDIDYIMVLLGGSVRYSVKSIPHSKVHKGGSSKTYVRNFITAKGNLKLRNVISHNYLEHQGKYL